MPKSKFEVIVTVEQCGERLSAKDRLEDFVKDYSYTVNAKTEREAVRLGLDEFHSEVAIDRLEDFDITAYVLT